MKPGINRTIGLSLFIFMCIIVWWSITTDYGDDKHSQLSKNSHYIELFMNEFELTAMNEEGKPSYLMTGLYMQRYNNSDVAEVKKPVLHILQPDNQWLISADTAVINNKSDTIQLKDNVVMQQQNVVPALTMHTQKMLINTKTQIARTRTQVKIVQGTSRLNAKGIIYNNITSKLELLSNVNGFYIPGDTDAK